jgi:hypothetical protein
LGIGFAQNKPFSVFPYLVWSRQTDRGGLEAKKMKRDGEKKVSPKPKKEESDHSNRDPLSGEPGAHPLGTGTGAMAGGAAGAMIGAAGGPLGAGIGIVVGAVAGGYAGKGLAELVNPTLEDEYWQHHYESRPYVTPGAAYEAWRPAYRYGWESCVRYPGRSWSDVETHLGRDWDRVRGECPLEWESAKHASRDAWERIQRKVPDTISHRRQRRNP